MKGLQYVRKSPIPKLPYKGKLPPFKVNMVIRSFGWIGQACRSFLKAILSPCKAVESGCCSGCSLKALFLSSWYNNLCRWIWWKSHCRGCLHMWVFPKIRFFLPQIIHFNRVFHYKPSIVECFTPIFGNTHISSLSFFVFELDPSLWVSISPP